jgi:hypothetical protein
LRDISRDRVPTTFVHRMPQCSASETSSEGPVQVGPSSLQEKEMHDGKLLSDNEMGSTEIRGQAAPIAVQATGHLTSRANFWTIVGFSVAGLICSFFVQTAYLHMERTSVLLAEAPLS